MKFEKFFKKIGTHGLIVKRANGEMWLTGDGVGMVIPSGVNNLGVSVDPDDVFKAIVNSESDDDILKLCDAILLEPDGKANDIVRIFQTDEGDRIGIYNAHYGLTEKRDILTYLEIEKADAKSEKDIERFIVIRKADGTPVGFIAEAFEWA